MIYQRVDKHLRLLDLRVLEHERLDLLFDGERDSLNLLGNDGKHLEVDSVELVETAPGTRRGQSLKKTAKIQILRHQCNSVKQYKK